MQSWPLSGTNDTNSVELLTYSFPRSVAAHTPDNSFLGFVVEQHLNASDIKHIDDVKRQNQSLVYGKVDNFWKVTSSLNALILNLNSFILLLICAFMFFFAHVYDLHSLLAVTVSIHLQIPPF